MCIFKWFRKNPDKKTENDKFKVKVEPFGRENDYYAIYYSFNNGRWWERYEYNILYDDEFICHNDQPYLYKDFDKAVEVAKGLTAEVVEEHNNKMAEEFKRHISKIRTRREERNKTFKS